MTANQLETNKPEATDSTPKLPPTLILFIILSVAEVALALSAIFIKLSVRDISAEATLFNRFWIAAIIFGVWNGWGNLRQKNSDVPVADRSYQLSDILLLAIVAVTHLLSQFLWTWSLTQTNMINACVLANMPPIFTALGGWLFLGQRFDRRFAIGAIVALIGAFSVGLGDLIASGNSLFSSTTVIGDTAAFLSSAFYGGSFLIVEQLRNKIPVQNILVWRCFLGTIFMLPVMLTFEDRIFPISWVGWLAVFGLAAITEALGHGLIAYSLKYLSSTFVTIFLLFEPAVTAGFNWLIFSEGLNPLNLLPFAMIMGGVYLAKTGRGADKQQNSSATVESLVTPS